MYGVVFGWLDWICVWVELLVDWLCCDEVDLGCFYWYWFWCVFEGSWCYVDCVDWCCD